MKRVDLTTFSRWICELVRCSTPVVRRHLERKDAATLAAAEIIGVLRPAGRLDQWECHGCDSDYVGQIRCSQDFSWTRHCLCRGDLPIDPRELDLVQLDRDGLLSALAIACGARKLAGKPDQLVVRLAELSRLRGQGTFTVAYSDRLDNAEAVAALVSTLLNDFKSGGVVVTPCPVPSNLPLPKKYSVIQLERAFYFDGQALRLDTAALDDRLAFREAVPGRPGPKSPIDMEKSIWLQQCNTADWPHTDMGQAERILTHWPVEGPGPNKVGTIAGHIAKHRKEWLLELRCPEPADRR